MLIYTTTRVISQQIIFTAPIIERPGTRQYTERNDDPNPVPGKIKLKSYEGKLTEF